MPRTEELISTLAAAGNRVTAQRRAICQVLAESREHPAPGAVYERVRQAYPGISRATVYNTLSLLRRLGEVTEVGLGREERHYEADPHPHVNLICLQCGRIEDLEEPLVGDLSARLANEHALELKGARMDVYGYCRACRGA